MCKLHLSTLEFIDLLIYQIVNAILVDFSQTVLLDPLEIYYSSHPPHPLEICTSRPPSLLEFLVTFHGTTHLQHLTRKLGIPYISYKVQKRCNTKSVGYTVQIEKPELDLVVITPCHLTKSIDKNAVIVIFKLQN